MSSPDWSRVRGSSVGDTHDNLFESPRSQHTETEKQTKTYDGDDSPGEPFATQNPSSLSSSNMNPAAPDFLPYQGQQRINAESTRFSHHRANLPEEHNDSTLAAVQDYSFQFLSQAQNLSRTPQYFSYQSHQHDSSFETGTQQPHLSINPRLVTHDLFQQGVGVASNGIVLILCLRRRVDKAEDEWRHAQNRIPLQGSGDARHDTVLLPYKKQRFDRAEDVLRHARQTAPHLGLRGLATAGDGVRYYHYNGTVHTFDPRGWPPVEEGRVIGSLQLRSGPHIASSHKATQRRHSISLGHGASDRTFYVGPINDTAAVGITIPATTSGREHLMSIEKVAAASARYDALVPLPVKSHDPDGHNLGNGSIRPPQTPQKKTGKIFAMATPKTSTPKTSTPQISTPQTGILGTSRRYGVVTIVPRELNLESGLEMTARETLT